MSIYLKAKGDASLVGTLTDGYTATGYAAVSMNAGFSLSETKEHMGGKYIVAVKYAERYDLALSLADIAAGELEMAVVVKVYDNSDKKVGEYEFTAADFAAAAF